MGEFEFMSEKVYILYDFRAKSGDTDDAAVISSTWSEEGTKQDKSLKDQFDGIWYEYDIQGSFMVNGKPRWDL
jgi:hypothetical protein